METMDLSKAQIAETYLDAYRSKDPAKALLATNVSLQYPLTPKKVVGRDNVVQYMLSVMPGFDGVELERHLIDGDYVTTLWTAVTVWGRIPACSVFRVSEGSIAEVRSYFDPRPILQRQ